MYIYFDLEKYFKSIFIEIVKLKPKKLSGACVASNSGFEDASKMIFFFFCLPA